MWQVLTKGAKKNSAAQQRSKRQESGKTRMARAVYTPVADDILIPRGDGRALDGHEVLVEPHGLAHLGRARVATKQTISFGLLLRARKTGRLYSDQREV